MAEKPAAQTGLEPLQDLFEGILSRLEILEQKTGCSSGFSSQSPSQRNLNSTKKPASTRRLSVVHVPPSEAAESVIAFDDFIKKCVIPFTLAIDVIEGPAIVGKSLLEAFDGVRGIIVLATKSKAPEEPLHKALAEHLLPTQEALKEIHSAKVGRDFDRHLKAILEMAASFSWVLMKAPDMLPSAVVKDAIGSSDYWTNKIRKDFKNDENQMDFCDSLKKLLNEMVAYVEKYHKTGLTWNPKGVSLAEAAARLGEIPEDENKDLKSPVGGKPRRGMGSMVGGNMTGLMEELAKKRNQDGSSAATGLKHVSKDQQTWRKEFKSDGSAKVVKTDPVPPKKAEKKTKPTGIPIFEYQQRGNKWVVENQTAQTVKAIGEGGMLKVEVSDPKQQVYMYNCDGITVQVVGSKFKSLIVDKCTKCNVVFDTVISSTEVVNSKKIQFQTTGVCPVFSIDKTIGCLVWLSKESAAVTSFVSSQSSEMNVSFPDGDDQKELPIPEQFVHRLVNGAVTSEVSDLYH